MTLYSFAPLACGEACEQMAETMREVPRRLPAEVDLGEAEYSLVTIALADAPSPEALTAAAGSAGADGTEWRGIGGAWDRVRTVVGTGFRRYFERIESGEVVFDPDEVGATDVELVYDLPGESKRLWSRATGIRRVLVNGVTTLVDGEATDALPGFVLRSGRDTDTVLV